MLNLAVALYGLCSVGLLYFAAYRIKIIFLAVRSLRRRTAPLPPAGGFRPKVCIQCPCYNEPLVIEGLLECVARLRWPGELEVQGTR